MQRRASFPNLFEPVPAMAIQEGFFKAHDGVDIFFRVQPGPDEPILLIHGHGEHSGRYLKFFDRLQDLRRTVAIFDLRGCGRSGGPPVYVSGFEDYLKDIAFFRNFLKKEYGIVGRLQLFGHSLGGLIATAWAYQEPDSLSKLILSSPLFGIPSEGFIRVLVNALDRAWPRWVIKNVIRPPFLTHDPQEIEKYRRDPLIRRRISVRLVHEMLRYISFFKGREISFSIPVYILMAGKDFVVDSCATRRFFDHLRAPEKKLEAFPGFYHEIFNEIGQEKAFERLRYYLVR